MAEPQITWPEPGQRVEARVDVTEKHYTCSLPAPTRDHPHRIVTARVRAWRDPLIGEWSIEVERTTDKKVRGAFPAPLWAQSVQEDWVDTYGVRLAQRIVHVLWLHDRREHLAGEVSDDWRSAGKSEAKA